MIYSCFDDARGVYRYFQDGDNRPINADLPVPTFRSRTKIGVPAIEAGRPLPASAQPCGEGWHARGMVVRCGGSALSFAGFGESAGGGVVAVPLLITGLAALAGAFAWKAHRGFGAAAGAAAGWAGAAWLAQQGKL